MSSVDEVRRMTRGFPKVKPPPIDEGEKLLYINLTTGSVITLRKAANLLVLRVYKWARDPRFKTARGAWYPVDLELQPVDFSGLRKALFTFSREVLDM